MELFHTYISNIEAALDRMKVGTAALNARIGAYIWFNK
jgi:hypothetical protein